jgi:hypothetical protein
MNHPLTRFPQYVLIAARPFLARFAHNAESTLLTGIHSLCGIF